MKPYDVIIVGAGPMGIALGIECKRNQLSHLILEKETLVNSIYHFPQNMTFFSTSVKLEIGEVPFISHHEKPTRSEALEYYRRVVGQWSLNVKTYHPVTNVQKIEGHFWVETPQTKYKANHVVIATGFYAQPNLLNIPGEELPKVSHYYTNAHPYINQKVVVIGAANSAVQVALDLYYKGADVTMVVRENEIGQNVKYWIRPNIVNRIEERSIKAYFNSEVKEIKTESIVIQQQNKEIEIENDFVFAMTGYHPDYSFLQKIGIQCDTDEFNTPLHDENSHQTNQKGLYVAGVVCGGKNTSKYFIENSREHAQKIIQAILEKP